MLYLHLSLHPQKKSSSLSNALVWAKGTLFYLEMVIVILATALDVSNQLVELIIWAVQGLLQMRDHSLILRASNHG